MFRAPYPHFWLSFDGIFMNKITLVSFNKLVFPVLQVYYLP